MQIHVAKNGQQTGPFDEAQVREKLATGEFAPTDLAWHADLAGWQPLSTLFPEALSAPASPVAATPVFPPAPSFGEPPASAPAPFAMPPPATGGYAALPVVGAAGAGQLAPPQFYNPGAVGDPNLASPGSRLLAVIIDVAIVYALYLPAFILGAFRQQEDGSMSPLGIIGMLVSAVLVLGYAGYQIYKLSTTGQTIGKKIAGARVVMLDGSPANFVQAVLMRVIVNAIPGVCFVYSIVDACFIFRQDRRCIHDLIAGTKVVRA